MDSDSDEISWPGSPRVMRRRSGGSQADIFRAPSDLPGQITGNSADAEEIAQEALLQVWTHAPRWRPVEHSGPGCWWQRILNLSLNRRRRAPFLPLEQAGDIADPASDASATLERVETDGDSRPPSLACPRASATPSCSLIARGSATRRTSNYYGCFRCPAVETLLVHANRTLRAALGAGDKF